MAFELQINYKNWSRIENHALFDYKQDNNSLETITIKTSGLIYRHMETYALVFVSHSLLSKSGEKQDYEPLLYIIQEDGVFKISDIKNHEQPLSLIAPQNYEDETKGVNIQNGSIIRVGRLTIEVIKVEASLCNGKSFYEKNKKLDMEGISRISLSSYGQDEECDYSNTEEVLFSGVENNPVCRFCYSKTIESDNILLIFCKCQGSAKYIHETCLRDWVMLKSQITSTANEAYENCIYVALMKGFECEICKSFYSPEKIISLLSSQNKHSKFKPISEMREYISFCVSIENKKLIYIVDLMKVPKIQFGRDSDNEIEFNELSVSRKHCQIVYSRQQKTLRLFDLQSKFGTLVKKSSILVHSELELQKGRTYMRVRKVENKNKWNLLENFGMCIPGVQ